MFARFLISLAIPAILLSSQAATAAPNHASELPPGDDALVTRVIDGDTIEVKVKDTPFKLRYIGIDAPETTGSKVVTCFAKEATAANKALVLGKTLRLERDVRETDKYGRLLRYAYLPDGTLVNEALVKTGFAQAVTYPPDVKRAEQFAVAQKAAHDAHLGLWSKCVLPVVTLSKPVVASTALPATTAVPVVVPTAAPSNAATSSAAGSVAPVDAWTCPQSHPIKGNRNSMIYHTQSSRSYEKTKPEECFATEADAVAAGYRAPKR